jgi:hypothetical protein
MNVVQVACTIVMMKKATSLRPNQALQPRTGEIGGGGVGAGGGQQSLKKGLYGLELTKHHLFIYVYIYLLNLF